MRPLTTAAALTAAAAAGIVTVAALAVRAREAALARAAGPTDDVCQCRICARVRGSGLVTRAIAETRAQDAAAERLRTIAGDPTRTVPAATFKAMQDSTPDPAFGLRALAEASARFSREYENARTTATRAADELRAISPDGEW